MKLNAFRLIHAIPSEGCDRYAVASLGDKVFVAGEGGIEVYNATTVDLLCNLTLHRLGLRCYGLAACSSNNCLYASDCNNSRIHRVDLSDSSAVKQWSVASRPRGLSVNKEHSVVGLDGQIVHSYDQSQASNVGPMNSPRSLAVTKNDDILVADQCNHRIVSLNSSLSSAQVLALPVDIGLQLSIGLCLDETRGRLYISESGGSSRVLVFESRE